MRTAGEVVRVWLGAGELVRGGAGQSRLITSLVFACSLRASTARQKHWNIARSYSEIGTKEEKAKGSFEGDFFLPGWPRTR